MFRFNVPNIHLIMRCCSRQIYCPCPSTTKLIYLLTEDAYPLQSESGGDVCCSPFPVPRSGSTSNHIFNSNYKILDEEIAISSHSLSTTVLSTFSIISIDIFLSCWLSLFLRLISYENSFQWSRFT